MSGADGLPGELAAGEANAARAALTHADQAASAHADEAASSHADQAASTHADEAASSNSAGLRVAAPPAGLGGFEPPAVPLRGRRLAGLVLLALLLAFALAVPQFGQPYYTKLVARMAIFGIAAMSLDLLVGYAGLVSFGHAAFFGIGVYAAGLLPFAGIREAWIVFPAAIGAAALVGALTGAVSLRASGLYFIFITLAFAEMIFYIAQGLRMFGGDDGFRLPAPTVMVGEVTLADPVSLAYTMIALLLLLGWIAHRVAGSRFGRVIIAARDNESKLRAIGLSPYPYRLALYSLAGAMAAVAGVGYGNLVEYASPASMSWVQSGEFLFMVILGSAATVVGPVLGAVLFVGLEQVLSGWTEHWLFYLGLVLVLRVLLLRQGIYGLIMPARRTS